MINNHAQNAPELPQFLTTQQAAQYLNLSVPTLERYRCAGIGPKAHRLGTKTIRYRREDLDAWAQPTQSTSEAA